MHYKNGREAKAGDKTICLTSGRAGILYNPIAGTDSCNGRLAFIQPSDPYINLNECLHVDDVAKATIPDSSKVVTAIVALIAMVSLLFAPAAHAQVEPQTYGNCISNVMAVIHKSTNFTASQFAIIDVPNGKDLLITPQFVGGDSTNTGVVGFKLTRYYGQGGTNKSTTTIPLTTAANGVTYVRDPIVVLSSTLGPATKFAITGMTNASITTDVTGGSMTLSNVLYQWRN